MQKSLCSRPALPQVLKSCESASPRGAQEAEAPISAGAAAAVSLLQVKWPLQARDYSHCCVWWISVGGQGCQGWQRGRHVCAKSLQGRTPSGCGKVNNASKPSLEKDELCFFQ